MNNETEIMLIDPETTIKYNKNLTKQDLKDKILEMEKNMVLKLPTQKYKTSLFLTVFEFTNICSEVIKAQNRHLTFDIDYYKILMYYLITKGELVGYIYREFPDHNKEKIPLNEMYLPHINMQI